MFLLTRVGRLSQDGNGQGIGIECKHPPSANIADGGTPEPATLSDSKARLGPKSVNMGIGCTLADHCKQMVR